MIVSVSKVPNSLLVTEVDICYNLRQSEFRNFS